MDVSLNPLLDNELNQINMNILEVAFARIDREWNMKNVLSPFIRLYYVQSGEAYIEYKKERLNWRAQHLSDSIQPGIFLLVRQFHV